MTLDALHLDRARAESFGAAPDAYDRFRSTCAEALLDDLVALRPAQVLDVACGTGKTARGLARRGLSVLGVELDERMAAAARRHGIAVEVAPFETWEDGGRTYDLVTCSDAWHWIDPERGVAKAAKVTRPGGTLARFWSYHLVDATMLGVFEAVYSEHAPEAHVHGRSYRDGATAAPADMLAASASFGAHEERRYCWEQTLTADEWIGLTGTFSDHQRLGRSGSRRSTAPCWRRSSPSEAWSARAARPSYSSRAECEQADRQRRQSRCSRRVRSPDGSMSSLCRIDHFAFGCSERRFTSSHWTFLKNASM